MQFVYPDFLWALLCLLIPIIIHLLNFQRFRPLIFSNVAFLKSIQKESRSKSNIKQWLILFSRLAAIFFLVLAFAQPYVPRKSPSVTDYSTNVLLYIDNSYSMNNINSRGTLLTQAKKMAIDITENPSFKNKRFLILNNGESLSDVWVDAIRAREKINAITFSPYKIDMSLLRYTLASHASSNVQGFIFSDFQKSNFTNEFVLDTLFKKIQPIQLQPNQFDNVSIDTCWFSDPYRLLQKEDRIYFTISNHSNKIKNQVNVMLWLNNQQKGIVSLDIPALTQIDTFIAFTVFEPGLYSGVISLEDNPVNFDDQRFFSYSILDTKKVLSIYENQASTSVARLFSKEPSILFQSQNIDQVDYRNLWNQQVIILEGILKPSTGLLAQLSSWVKKGGHIVCFLPEGYSGSFYQEFFNHFGVDVLTEKDTAIQQISYINEQANLFKNVFKDKGRTDLYGKINNLYTISPGSRTAREDLIKTERGHRVLSFYPLEKGGLYMFFTNIGSSKYAIDQQAIFVPSLLNVAYQSAFSQQIYYTLARQQRVEINVFDTLSIEQAAKYFIKDEKGTFEFIADVRYQGNQSYLYLQDQLTIPGPYKLLKNDKVQQIVSLNLDQSESNLLILSEEEMQKNNPYSSIYRADGKNNELFLKQLDRDDYWYWSLLGALFFLLIETFLLRYIKI